MSIPRIIHQTAKYRDFYGVYEEFHRKLRAFHPGWDFRFYDDRDCRKLIKQYFGKLLSVYDGYAHAIQRTDLFRIAAVFQFGGFYVDLDVECFKPIDDLCRNTIVFGEEKVLTPREKRRLRHRDAQRIGNYMFGSVPQHPFLADVMIRMTQESMKPIEIENDILETTGPGLLTRVYFDLKNHHTDITMLGKAVGLCPHCVRRSCHFGDYALHHHVGSWRWQNNFEGGANITHHQRISNKIRIDGIYHKLKRLARNMRK
jgi:mannosyltransferase OCH1-like enzyme